MIGRIRRRMIGRGYERRARPMKPAPGRSVFDATFLRRREQ